jgi:hypothetical protein
MTVLSCRGAVSRPTRPLPVPKRTHKQIKAVRIASQEGTRRRRQVLTRNRKDSYGRASATPAIAELRYIWASQNKKLEPEDCLVIDRGWPVPIRSYGIQYPANQIPYHAVAFGDFRTEILVTFVTFLQPFSRHLIIVSQGRRLLRHPFRVHDSLTRSRGALHSSVPRLHHLIRSARSVHVLYTSSAIRSFPYPFNHTLSKYCILPGKAFSRSRLAPSFDAGVFVIFVTLFSTSLFS